MTGSVAMLSGQSDAVSAFTRRLPTQRTFYLRNTGRSEAIHLPSRDLRTEVTLMRFLPFAFGFAEGENSGFTARAAMLFYSPRLGGNDVAIHVDEEWMNGAELVIVRSTPAGSVERQLAIAPFPIRAN
jgi:hypothetical protein